jgi:hypothetical protein
MCWGAVQLVARHAFAQHAHGKAEEKQLSHSMLLPTFEPTLSQRSNPFLFIELGYLRQGSFLPCRHPHAESTCELHSCQVPWFYTITLANFALGRSRGVAPTAAWHEGAAPGLQAPLQRALRGCAGMLGA